MNCLCRGRQLTCTSFSSRMWVMRRLSRFLSTPIWMAELKRLVSCWAWTLSLGACMQAEMCTIFTEHPS